MGGCGEVHQKAGTSAVQLWMVLFSDTWAAVSVGHWMFWVCESKEKLLIRKSDDSYSFGSFPQE